METSAPKSSGGASLFAVNIKEYLTRIGYAGDVRPTIDVLCALQERHLLSIPFENLNIHTGRRIVLEPAVLFKKIVVTRRGGFCYELNGLFALLLQSIGFQVRLAEGRVYDRSSEAFGPPFDHMVVLVEIDGQTWLVDVGFGDFSLHPLEVGVEHPQKDRNGEFVIVREDAEYFNVQRLLPEERRYVPEYLFSTKARTLEDFSEMCLYHQTSPRSHFTRQRVCSIATPTGRITLTDEKLISTQNGIRSEQPISNRAAFDLALARYFDISM